MKNANRAGCRDKLRKVSPSWDKGSVIRKQCATEEWSKETDDFLRQTLRRKKDSADTDSLVQVREHNFVNQCY